MFVRNGDSAASPKWPRSAGHDPEAKHASEPKRDSGERCLKDRSHDREANSGNALARDSGANRSRLAKNDPGAKLERQQFCGLAARSAISGEGASRANPLRTPERDLAASSSSAIQDGPAAKCSRAVAHGSEQPQPRPPASSPGTAACSRANTGSAKKRESV